MISLLFLLGSKIVIKVEVPQYVKFTCTKSHEKGSLEKIVEEYSFQAELPKREIEHSFYIKNCSSPKHIWQRFLKLYVLCLAFIHARHSIEKKNMTVFVIKDYLTEAS